MCFGKLLSKVKVASVGACNLQNYEFQIHKFTTKSRPSLPPSLARFLFPFLCSLKIPHTFCKESLCFQFCSTFFLFSFSRRKVILVSPHGSKKRILSPTPWVVMFTTEFHNGEEGGRGKEIIKTTKPERIYSVFYICYKQLTAIQKRCCAGGNEIFDRI